MNVQFDTGFAKISIVPVLWVLVCAYAYFKVIEDDIQLFDWSVWITCVVMFIVFGLSFWHPQWLLMAMPFFTLAAVYNKRTDIYMLLDILLMGCYTFVIINFWICACDQGLLVGGIFGNKAIGIVSNNFKMQDFIPIHDYSLFFTAFVAVLLIYVVFSNPNRMNRSDCMFEQKGISGLIRLRCYCGLAIFLLPCAICLIINFTQPRALLLPGTPSEPMAVMEEDSCYEQVFVSPGYDVSAVSVEFGTYNKKNKSTLYCELVEADTGDVVAAIEMKASKLKDCAFVQYDFDEAVHLDEGHKYSVVITGKKIKKNDQLSLFKMADKAADDNRYSIINGEKQDFDLAIDLIGVVR